MTLAELISEVYTITGRPDRVAETASAIKSATLKAHLRLHTTVRLSFPNPSLES
jgi:hypothetical protein